MWEAQKKEEKKKKEKAHGVFENGLSLKLFMAICTETSCLSMLLNTAVRERHVNSTVAQVLRQAFSC